MMMIIRVKIMMLIVGLIMVGLTPLLWSSTEALEDHHANITSGARTFAKHYNVSCILVFGDSSVDPGNNNILPTTMKSNFPPYGKGFFNGHPTGRFSDGRLATDFIAESLGFEQEIPAFLDPSLKPDDLLHGVSFASAASGYDDLTANLSNVLSVPQQLKYFMHYKIHLSKLVGHEKALNIINNAIIIISMGTNDFLQNYYIEPVRSKQFDIEGYQDFLIQSLTRDLKMMFRIGARRLVIVGVPPLGCMPLVKTLYDEKICVDSYNKVANSFNAKINATLVTIKQKLGMATAFVDTYAIIEDAINNPKKFGLTETSKGCCGTGLIEYGDTCKGLDTCADPSKYVFWDAVHPTEKMYKILADEAVESCEKALST